jgi:predicted O-linked N-acetylglucosamine transferase (SPINDLY family)
VPVASSNLDEACTEAMKHHINGRPDLAESLYREILRVDPGHANANYCIGMVYVHLRRACDGIPHLVAALEANPQSRDYWLGYMEALLMSGRTDEAKTTLALGRQHGLDGRAVEDFARRLDAHVRAALHMESAMLAMLEMGKLSEARGSAREMTERFPERGLGWKTWGALLGAAGQTDDALAAMRVSARLMPRDAETHTNLAATLMKLERLDEAEACLKTALEVDPDCAVAYAHLGTVYQLQHRYTEAEASLRRSILLSPNDIEFNEIQRRTSLLFVLSHNPAVSADELFAEHCRVGAHWEAGLVATRPRHSNIPDPERRLQIGMVSGDFCDHSIAGFVEPVLALLRNYESIELHGYHNKDSEDHVTRRLRGHFDHWRPVLTLSNEQLADQIKDDGIDVLFDLSGHTFRNRLAAFALKPAPIQVSWLGYPGTSGLSAMDYYLADRHWLPPGEFDGQFTEKLVYLPDRWAFQRHANAPTVNDLPALVAGSLTFGSFNRMSKLTPSTLRLWAPLLRALPNARMLLGDMPAEDDQHRLIDEFAAQGITRERLILHGRSTMDAYLALHHRVDLCLDTVPYAGGTTTMHALSMGVPTLTLAGSTSFGRAGAGILAQLGLEAFTATDDADFIAKGEYWATHLGALAEVRRGLRARLQQSPERQPDFFVAQFERALRHMWRRWCAGVPAESFHSSELS